MKHIYKIFMIPILHCISCNASVSNDISYKNFTQCVSEGNRACLNKIPESIKSLDFNESIMLRNALSHSILKNPLDTIEALDRIDKTPHSFIRDNYGSDTVCGYMIDSNKYDRNSFFKYYSKARLNLEKIGSKGKYCLNLMNSSVEEITYEEKQGKTKWGIDKYVFD